MKKLSIFFVVFFSLVSLGETKISLNDKARNYSLILTLSEGESGPMSGSVEATTPYNKMCSGRYAIHFDIGEFDKSFEVTFDGVGGPGTGGGCHNESFSVAFNRELYEQFVAGAEVQVNYRSSMFFNQVRPAFVKIVD